MKFFQRLGRSIMLPVAVLPVAAILLGVGYWITNLAGDNIASAFLTAAGGALIDNMALLFAIGISIGMADKSDGTSALAGLVSWLTVTTLLKPETVQLLIGAEAVESVDPAFGKIQNVFVGIICGLIGAWSYNRFKDTKLPDYLSFFSGKRSVAIITAGISLVVAVALFFIWPFVYNGLVIFGEWMLTLGPVGAGIYGFLNRLLIPLGLHHALNSVFWFDVAGINDLNNFLAGTGTFGVTGQYMAGFFPIMMFGLPGAALAMYVTAKTKRRKATAGIMISAAFASFLTGVTEPLEFAFMFLAPVLYVVHAAFTGISMFIAALLPTRMGFGFSAGFIDMVLGWANPMAQNPWMLLVMGVFWFGVYFIVFRFVILKLKLPTPGREPEDEAVTGSTGTLATAGGGKYATAASGFLHGLGGKRNITSLDNCTTRLRLEVADPSLVDDQALKRAGAIATVKPGGKSVQVIYGLNVQFVRDAMDDIIAGRVPEEGPDQTADAAAAVAESAVVRLRQPVQGQVITLQEVPDEVFAAGTLGPGLAVQPVDGMVVAPAAGRVVSVAPHAVGLALSDGIEVLVHAGIDTVKLNGAGLEALVAEGDEVAAGTPLLRLDLDAIKAAGYSAVTPVVVLNRPGARVEFV
ncbi:N-acetylglucosamine-specific PTS transporter subunit IIBC [Agrococcus casei]|uniref:N-acetylglucosamine-specific PTS transporter subunit IIBC n=1 Tax=Agrococcus casei TaxID=343512 RepID=UPI003F921A86